MASASSFCLALLVAALGVGCAATDDKLTSTEPRPAREYRTGSNIPIRDPQPATEEDRARAAEQLRQTQDNGGTARPN